MNNPNALRIPKNQVKSRNSIEQSEHEDQAHARRVLLVDYQGDPIDATNPLPVSATINVSPGAGLDTPVIANVSALLANTEYSYIIPDGTGKLSIKVRPSDAIIKYSWNAGQSGTNYITIGYGVEREIVDVNMVGKTIYFQVSKPNRTIEFESWS
jgi:hypothetical protein